MYREQLNKKEKEKKGELRVSRRKGKNGSLTMHACPLIFNCMRIKKYPPRQLHVAGNATRQAITLLVICPC